MMGNWEDILQRQERARADFQHLLPSMAPPAYSSRTEMPQIESSMRPVGGLIDGRRYSRDDSLGYFELVPSSSASSSSSSASCSPQINTSSSVQRGSNPHSPILHTSNTQENLRSVPVELDRQAITPAFCGSSPNASGVGNGSSCNQGEREMHELLSQKSFLATSPSSNLVDLHLMPGGVEAQQTPISGGGGGGGGLYHHHHHHPHPYHNLHTSTGSASAQRHLAVHQMRSHALSHHLQEKVADSRVAAAAAAHGGGNLLLARNQSVEQGRDCNAGGGGMRFVNYQNFPSIKHRKVEGYVGGSVIPPSEAPPPSWVSPPCYDGSPQSMPISHTQKDFSSGGAEVLYKLNAPHGYGTDEYGAYHHMIASPPVGGGIYNTAIPGTAMTGGGQLVSEVLPLSSLRRSPAFVAAAAQSQMGVCVGAFPGNYWGQITNGGGQQGGVMHYSAQHSSGAANSVYNPQAQHNAKQLPSSFPGSLVSPDALTREGGGGGGVSFPPGFQSHALSEGGVSGSSPLVGGSFEASPPGMEYHHLPGGRYPIAIVNDKRMGNVRLPPSSSSGYSPSPVASGGGFVSPPGAMHHYYSAAAGGGGPSGSREEGVQGIVGATPHIDRKGGGSFHPSMIMLPPSPVGGGSAGLGGCSSGNSASISAAEHLPSFSSPSTSSLSERGVVGGLINPPPNLDLQQLHGPRIGITNESQEIPPTVGSSAANVHQNRIGEDLQSTHATLHDVAYNTRHKSDPLIVGKYSVMARGNYFERLPKQQRGGGVSLNMGPHTQARDVLTSTRGGMKPHTNKVSAGGKYLSVLSPSDHHYSADATPGGSPSNGRGEIRGLDDESVQTHDPTATALSSRSGARVSEPFRLLPKSEKERDKAERWKKIYECLTAGQRQELLVDAKLRPDTATERDVLEAISRRFSTPNICISWEKDKRTVKLRICCRKMEIGARSERQVLVRPGRVNSAYVKALEFREQLLRLTQLPPVNEEPMLFNSLDIELSPFGPLMVEKDRQVRSPSQNTSEQKNQREAAEDGFQATFGKS